MAFRLAATCLFLTCLASVATAQVTAPQRVRVSDRVEQGLIIKKVSPVYPPLARQAGIQGTVILRVEINQSGDVESMQLFSGHPMLAPAAIDAVEQWKYRPYLLNGEPVAVETQVTVNFTLSPNPPSEGVVGDRPGGIPPGEIGGLKETDRPGVVRVSKAVMSVLLVSKVPPDYPPDAKEARIQGAVVMRVDVDKEGNVANIQLVSGHPMLAPAAIEAVKQWKYKPFLLNGSPVEVETRVVVSFTLES